jgi:hypothetical protein
MSPVKIRKLKSGKYRVYNGDNITAFATTKLRATRQARLLRAAEHGFVPTGKKAR